MARPSRNIDEALLAAGLELFPRHGCARLTLRAVAERAGVRVGMFHYHFGTKDAFLRALLQRMYDGMFATLVAPEVVPGSAVDRLRHALLTLAHFARTHRAAIGRVWIDAMQHEPVALAFFRDNAPRHVGVLSALVAAAHREGSLRELPLLQTLVLLLGSVPLPMIFVGGLADAGAAPLEPRRLEAEVMTNAAVRQRIEIVLAALAPPRAATRRPPAPRAARSRR